MDDVLKAWNAARIRARIGRVAEDSHSHDCVEPPVEIVRGDSLEVICPRCGRSAATSYLSFVWKDKTTYWLSIVSTDREKREQLDVLARIFGGTPVSIFKRMKLGVLPTKGGSAYAIRHDILALRDAGIAFRVDPPFPWKLADGRTVDHVPSGLTALAADETMYRVSVIGADRKDRAQLGTLVQIFGGTLSSLYRDLGSGVLPSLSGPALAVRGDLLVLRAAGVEVTVDPPFPWEMADGSRALNRKG